MAIQTATTGSLENAQNQIIAMCKFTAEHANPCKGLVTRYTLGKGEKSLYVPKVGQMSAAALTDGIDMTDSEEINLSGVTLTTSEVGLKVILTDKLVRQFNEDTFKVIGRQMGDAMDRKRDTDLIALFSALNSGTTLGKDNAPLLVNAAAGLAAWARSNKLPRPVYVVHHPNALADIGKSTMAIGATYYAGILGGISEGLFRNFWRYTIDGIGFFEDGNIEKISGYDSGYGALFSKDAMCFIESKAPDVERERDASLRAWEICMVTDYGCFELDNGYGAPAQYEIGTLETT